MILNNNITLENLLRMEEEKACVFFYYPFVNILPVTYSSPENL